MVYKRKPRPSFYFEAKTRTGWKQLCTHTPDKKLAAAMEHMWGVLADRYRAWDLLDPVLKNPRAIGTLYDRWTETKQDIEAVRRLAADVDVEPFVATWYAIYQGTVKADSAAHALAHVRHFFPADTPRMVSAVTDAWLTESLATYPGKRNTRRKVHSSLSSFFDYLTRVQRLFAVNPMANVERPAQEASDVLFYELDVVERIIGWQPTEDRRALFALLYGTSMDVSTALTLTRADVLPADKSVRARGTKTHTRDRVVRVADWAWPIFWGYCKAHLATAPIFPTTWDRWTVSDWHRQTVGEGVKDTHGTVVAKGLNLSPRLPLRNARHHWAATRMRAGVPVEVVSRQLGHSSTQLTHRVYGRFEPKAADRNQAETKTAAYEKRRRRASEN